MKFLFEVMEPLVQEFWQESIIPYAAEWDGVRDRLQRAAVR